MKILLITIALYLLLGIARIIRDFSIRPSFARPLYVRHPNLFSILAAFLWSPSFWWDSIKFTIRNKKTTSDAKGKAKERGKKIFEEIMKKKP